ncbi:MAG: hypothetical protein CM15mV137_100 [uncultured marine virus]|nr:MAG: hypothetical protein CM15mV137_100 [uncultured marine virus]
MITQNNVGVGAETLQALTTGDSNVVVGSLEHFFNPQTRNIFKEQTRVFAITSGNENVAVGNRALGQPILLFIILQLVEILCSVFQRDKQ